MFVLKACPRCHGDLTFDYDRLAGFLCCIQCGHTLSLAEERALRVSCTRAGLLRVVPPRRHEPRAREFVGLSR